MRRIAVYLYESCSNLAGPWGKSKNTMARKKAQRVVMLDTNNDLLCNVFLFDFPQSKGIYRKIPVINPPAYTTPHIPRNKKIHPVISSPGYKPPVLDDSTEQG